jgi:PAS domain S-box-containing protein
MDRHRRVTAAVAHGGKMIDRAARKLARALRAMQVAGTLPVWLHASRRPGDTELQRNFRNLFEHNPLPFWVFDAETLRFLEVNRAAINQYGYSRDEFLAMTILDIRRPEFHDRVSREVHDTSSPKWTSTQIWQHRRKDGSLLEVKIHTSDIEFRGRPARLILAEDMTETLSYQRELAFRACHEPVTGLPNARALAAAVESHREAGCRIAYVQLRGLELIEDSLGLDAGHAVLRTIADRLKQLGERYGLAGHVRGEEFALVVCDLARWDEALAELQAELARPVPGRDTLQQLDYWLGSACFPRDSEDPAQAIGRAGLAAHVARTEQATMAEFTPVMTQRASKRLDMAARIHRALDNDEFELHFQKLVGVEDGRPVGLEALLRWPQPDGSSIAPVEFIGISEDTGLIVPLGQWVVRQAAMAQRQLSDAGHGELSIAVNVSQAQFLKRDLATDFGAVFDEFSLRRGALHVELTESMLMTRPEAARATIHRLQERGICVSLDDFGTGFSSMSYLRHLPIDALKMDQSFVRGVHRDRRNAAICEALLALGHSMELTVIAEGVEEQAEYDWLREHRCDRAQGYYLGRPAPLATVMAAL